MGARLMSTVFLLAALGVVLVACEATQTTAPPLNSPAFSTTQVIPVDTATNGSGDAPPDSATTPGVPHDCPIEVGDDPDTGPDDGGPGDGDAEAPPCSGWVIQ